LLCRWGGLVGHEEPHDRVGQQGCAPGENCEDGEDHPDEYRVDAEVAADPAADARHDAVVEGAEELLVWSGGRLSHVSRVGVFRPADLGERPEPTLILRLRGKLRCVMGWVRKVGDNALICGYCVLSPCQESDRRFLEVT
jgi:hypothetical protein